MLTVNGSLTLNFTSQAPKCFWKGEEVLNIKRAHIHYDEDELRIKLVVNGTQDAIYAEMEASGINIKKGH